MNFRGQVARQGPLGKLLALVTGAALLALGLVFSLLVLAVVAIAGLAAWAYLWWKTRKLRQAMTAQAPHGEVFEGEAVVVADCEEETLAPRNVLPRDLPPR